MSIRAHLAPLVLVLSVAGCSVPQAGTSVSAPRSPVKPSTPVPSSTSPTGLAAIQACDLLTAQDAISLGLRPQGETDKILGLRRCDWTIPGGDGVSTSIDEKGGINELNLAGASSVTDVTIGRHRAKRAVEGSGPGYCDVFFAVGDTASVGVTALYLNDTGRACAVADQAAVLVEPKLP
jgi:hypothetical protein